MAVKWGGRGPGHTARIVVPGEFVGGGEPPVSGATITAPVLSAHSTDPNIAGDFKPTYNIAFVDAWPTGGGIGDNLEGRWGTSEAAAQALTPVSVEITEAHFIDGTDPFPELGTFGAAQNVGDTIHYQVRVVRGAEFSDWSNFRTLLIEDGVMNAPGLTDLTDQPVSTRVWSASFNVAGMATGAYARLKGTGPIRVGGTTVYEAGEEVQVQNGASLEFGVDTSASNNTAVNNVVTNRGVTIDTFTATTVAAAGYPASLYGPSDVGYAFDPTDVSKLFQQIDGTVAVSSNGDPIGRLVDVSGKSKHFNAVANNTTRPTWSNANGGMISFDGSNDYLKLEEAILFAAGACTIIYAVKGANQTSKCIWGEGGDGFPHYQPGTGTTAVTANRDRIRIINDAGSNVVDANSGLTIFDDTLTLITMTDTGSTVQVKELRVAGTARNYTRGAHTLQRAAFGAMLRSSPIDYFAGTLGRFLAIGRVLTGTELSTAEQWVADGHGVTLP